MSQIPHLHDLKKIKIRSKLSLLGFADITCSVGKFTFTEEFAVIDGMVLDMLLGIKWEHRYNIHPGHGTIEAFPVVVLY